MGYYCENNHYQKAFLKHNFFAIIKRMIVLLLCLNRKAWNKLFHFKKSISGQILSKDYISNELSIKGDLLSICVLSEYRGKGYSIDLINQFEMVLKKNDRLYSQLTVEADNFRGIRFYDKQGYIPYKKVEGKSISYYKKL